MKRVSRTAGAPESAPWRANVTRPARPLCRHSCVCPDACKFLVWDTGAAPIATRATEMRFHFEDHSFMACFFRPEVPALQRRSLAACIATLLAVNTITASADNEAIASSTSGNVPPSPNGFVRTVTNCDDSGPGSLRDTVLNAMGGDVIDLTQLTCSDITLFTGKIALASNDMALLGPGL